MRCPVPGSVAGGAAFETADPIMLLASMIAAKLRPVPAMQPKLEVFN
jgi:hypothetical protein